MRFVAAITVLCMAVAPCLGRDIYVAKDGSNSNGGGGGDPYLNINYAISQSAYGDVIHVRQGTYQESWLTPVAGTRIISEDGLYAAKIYSGNSSAIRLTNDDSGIEGLEIYANWEQGSAGDGLVRALGSNNVWVKDCLVHDAPYDCDVIKIGSSNVLIENVVAYSPSHRTNGTNYQEVIDIYGDPDPDGVTVRGCWLYHTPTEGGDILIYAKGGARNIVWENNVFGPAVGDPGNCSTGCGASSPAVFPACENFIARNNIFVGGNGDGAFEFTSARNAHVYNNVFYNYMGSRCVIQFYSTQPSSSPPQNDRNEDCYVYNNIFMQSNGYPIYQDRARWTDGVTYIPENFQHDYNVYYLCNTDPGDNDVDVTTEANSLFLDPQMVNPRMPVLGTDTWASLVDAFLLQGTSPAINEGLDLSSGAPYYVPYDILGTARPVDTYYDIGVHEYGVPGLPTIAFDSASSSGSESTTPANLAVSLSASSSDTVTVDYAVTGGTATGGGVDYTLAAGTLTLSPGVTSDDVVVTIVNDDLVESNETIQVTLSNPSNATLGANTVHTYTINDNDVYPSVEFDMVSSSDDESVTPASLSVSLSAAYVQTVTVDYAVTGGDATGGGVDYTLAAGTLTFDPNDVSKTIDIAIVNDGLVESDETVEVTLSNPSNATLGANTVHTYTILNDDADVTAPAAVTDLAASNPTTSSVDLAWTAPGDDGNTGTAASYDVRYSTATITEANWASATQATGEPAPSVAGTPESMTVSGLSEDMTYYFAIKTSDEVPNESALSNVANETTQAGFSYEGTIVQHVGLNVSAWRDGNNIPPTHGKIQNWPNSNADGTIGEFNRMALQNAIDDAITTYGGWSAKVIVTEPNWDGSGIDSDLAPMVASVQVDASTLVWGSSHAYDAGAGLWTYNSTTYPDFASAVLAGVGSGDSVVVTGPSFQANWNTSLPVPCWDIAIDVPQSLITDYINNTSAVGLFVGAEKVNANQNIYYGDQWSQQGNIRVLIGPGAAPLPDVEFDSASSSGSESASPANLGVSLSASSGDTITVDYAVTGGSATGGGVDYTLAAGTLTFDPNDVSETINISIVDDGDVESDETIEVTLSNPSNASLGANTVHTYTINDNDVYPSVDFDLTASSDDESVTPASLAVSLSAAYVETVTVDYAVTAGSATGGGVDYTLASGTLTFVPDDVAETIDITIVDDGDVESDETIEVTLSNPSNASLGANTVHTYTILDNDGVSPPGQASNPSPASGVTKVSRSAILSWTAGSGADSHDVYFGTNSNPGPSEFQGNQPGTTFDPGYLGKNTWYYWRIDEVNAGGTTTGVVWSFRTGR